MSDRSRLRLFVLQVLVLSLLATLLGRLWYLQVLDGEGYAEAASANRVREVVTPAPRGEIYDAAGKQLVRNRTALVVSVNRALLQREPDRGKAVLARLGKVLGAKPELLAKQITPCGGGVVDPCWRGSPYQPVPVQEYDARDPKALRKVLAVQEHREDFPGVTAEFAAVRDYPSSDRRRAAHVLGYLGPISQPETSLPQYADVQPTALIGRAGVEATYERELRGRDGVQELLVDHVGTVTGTQSETAPRPGDKLVLSLHAGVQAVAEQALESAILTARTRPYYRGGITVADSGSIVVMEAKTGRVVALASYPSYDPTSFTGGISSKDYAALTDEANGQALLFRATQGGYAPASTFKAVSALATVAAGQTTFDTVTDCPGSYAPLGGKKNFEGRSQGALTLRTAIVKSCDTNFYKFAYDAWLRDGGNRPVAEPKDPMITMATKFGLGRKTGIDLPGESKGLIPTRAWRKEYWEGLKEDFCKGAKNPAFDEQRRRRNAEACVDGYKFNGGQAANFSIGQGETLLTPLQLASVYATIANGGKVLRPTVGRALLSPDGRTVREISPTLRGKVPVDPAVLAQLRDALRGVTSEPGGTARGAFAGLPLTVAGKTGTGQVDDKQDTAWFASFAPAEDPQLVVVGLISQGGTGGSTAAPMVRKVYEGIWGLGGRPAVLPGGRLPAALPVVRPDGTVGPPGTPTPRRPTVSRYQPVAAQR
jgi:penicillin-binding protein 2